MSTVISDWNVGIIVSVPFIGSGIALLFTILFTLQVKNAARSSGSGRQSELMINIADTIQKGAKAFLVWEYKFLTVFVLVFAAILLIIFSVKDAGGGALDGVRYAGCFLCGALLSALAGWFGMMIATDANVRTTHAADSKGLNAALQVAFAGGSVMGFTVVGLGIFGVTLLFVLMATDYLGKTLDPNAPTLELAQSIKYLAGFGFGASSIALFARVAGGIYTKAADVGADLVGKVEEDLKEDDPKNPAVIADNVGDNVGDVAGMGADLFESYVGSVIAAATLADSLEKQALPFWIAGMGIFAAAVGSKCIHTKENANQTQLLRALATGTWVASVLSLGLSALSVWILGCPWKTFGCMVIGLVAGILIGESTEYATSYAFAPTKSIANSGETGPATVIIQGLGVGMLSCIAPVIILAITIVACDALEGGYGIAISAVGMLSTLGVTLATDAYGPVADNAGGIAEMAEFPEGVREITDSLDALGNTTAATGKGFAIGSAVLTALSLLASFKLESGLEVTDVADPIVLAGVLFGAALPFVFAALTMLSVRKAATSIILEVRRQFRTIPGLRNPESNVLPDYETCIAISTKASVEEMILPGACAILAPITIGFLVGPRCLAGMLSGAIASGFMLAVMMSNSGGAWDNAKKYIEIELKEKGTESHKAAVTGDTVGDPFKDTSGPALNILIKLMSMVSLVIAPLLGKEDWETYYWGFLPLAVLIIITVIIYCKYWKGFEAWAAKKHAEYDAIPTTEAEAQDGEDKAATTHTFTNAPETMADTVPLEVETPAEEIKEATEVKA